MDLFKQASRPPIDIELTPLINIVFLILIFFMLAGTITPKDALPVNAATSEIVEPAINAPADMVIALDSAGRFSVDSAVVSEEALQAALQKHRLSADATVALKADAALPASALVGMMGRLRQLGFADVTLLTLGAP